MRRKLTFGLHSQEQDEQIAPLLDAFCEWLGEKLDADVACDETPDYETLAQRVMTGAIEIAWLPPIVFVRVGDDVVRPIVALRRGSRGGFETALVVREDSPIQDVHGLAGTRAAWVDAWSAAGYVIPRIRLRLDQADPKTLFAEEHFYGSHAAAVRAVVDGEADVAGTYARVDGTGHVVDGSWTQIEGARVRVIAAFGEIPADVIAVARSLPQEQRRELSGSLLAVGSDPARRDIVKRIFGADGFAPVAPETYNGLRTMLSLGDWDELSTTVRKPT